MASGDGGGEAKERTKKTLTAIYLKRKKSYVY